MAIGDLEYIRTRIRRITRLPSENLMTTAQIDEYINTFIQYDFPEHIRLFQTRDTFEFVCQPNRDVYQLNELLNPLNPELDDFWTTNLTIHDPVYVQGRPVILSQSRSQFFAAYPLTQTISQVGAGDGVTTTFTGVITPGLIQRNTLTITSITAGTDTQSVYVQDDGTGILSGPNGGTGLVNYITGNFSVTFPFAPNSTTPVNAQYVAYVPNIPQAMLVFDNQITLRPIPDQPYTVQFEVYKQPTALIATTDFPQLKEWAQYIAFGASKKIFEDRSDPDSVQQITPEFQKQEMLCLRRTLVQQVNERNQTIYTQQVAGWNLGSGFWGSNFP